MIAVGDATERGRGGESGGSDWRWRRRRRLQLLGLRRRRLVVAAVVAVAGGGTTERGRRGEGERDLETLNLTPFCSDAMLDRRWREYFPRCYSSQARKNQELINELNSPPPGSNDLYFPTKYPQSFATQCIACFWKQHWSYWRNPPYNAIRFFATLIMALLFGTIFWNKGHNIGKEQELLNIIGAVFSAVLFLGATNATTVQPVVGIERTVFYRERAAGMYSSLAYAFAQVSIELVYILIQSLLYGLLLFPMLGFDWQAQKFLWFLFFIFMCFVYFTLYGMMVVALTPSFQIAGIITSFFFAFWNLFSGFVIARPMIPIWWRWCYWISPVAWTIYGIVASQVGDYDNLLEIPGKPSVTVKAYLKEHLGIEHNFLANVAIAQVGFVVLFTFIFAFAIRYLNFQKR